MLSGAAAGAVTGIFGAGGGLILVPLLSVFCKVEDDSLFPVSLSVMMPVCLCCVCILTFRSRFPISTAFPYMIGGAVGGIAAGLIGNRISKKLLHGVLGIFILWGGFRYLIG